MFTRDKRITRSIYYEGGISIMEGEDERKRNKDLGPNRLDDRHIEDMAIVH